MAGDSDTERSDSRIESLYGRWSAGGRGEEAFAELCAAHPELAAEWRAIRAGEALAELVAPCPALGSEGPVSGEKAGGERYERLGGELGHGGMGRVLRVRDRVLERELALKVALGADGREARAAELDPGRLRRFLAEARITARLSHPNIVPLHDLGADGEGRPYFTMKLVEGERLDAVFEQARAGREPWSLSRAVECLVRVCEAMAHAHARGVVHRDLKPSNVMVGPFGEVYVMDWGLARELGRDDPRDLRLVDAARPRSEGAFSPLVTADGHALGTPVYMAPEQARGELEAIGPRSDVYSVGAMLYELLAGVRPYAAPGSRMSPREALSRVLAGPPPRLRELAPDVPAELESICERAMARDVEARYADVSELAADLRAWLEGRVVRAHAVGALAELVKWVGRHRGLASGMAASLALALLASGLALRSAREAHARAAAEESERVKGAQLAASEELRAKSEELRVVSEALRREQSWTAYAAALDAARLALEAGDARAARERLELAPAELRRIEWHLLDRAARDRGRLLAQVAAPARALLLHPERAWLSVGAAQSVRFFDPAGGGDLCAPRSLPGRAVSLALDPRGLFLAVGPEPGAPLALELELEREDAPRRLQLAAPAALGITSSLAYSFDGALLASAHRGPKIRLWSMPEGDELPSIESGERQVYAVAFSPCERLLAAGTRTGARLYDVESRELLAHYRTGWPCYALAFDPLGASLAAAGMDRVLRVYPSGGGPARQELEGHRAEIVALAFDESGEWIASGDESGDVRLWHLRGARAPRVVANLGARAVGLAFASAQELLALGEDGALWALELEAAMRLVRVVGRHEHPAASTGAAPVSVLAFAPDGRHLASGADDSLVRVWDLVGGGEPVVLRGHRDRLEDLAFTPDGERLWTASVDRSVGLWDPRTGERLARLEGHERHVTAVLCLDEGRALSASLDGTLRLWEREGRPAGIAARWDLALRALARSAGGEWIAVGCDGGELLLLDADTLAEQARFDLGSPVASLAWLDGLELRAAGRDGSLFRIDVALGLTESLRGPLPASAAALAAAPDGSRYLLAAGELHFFGGPDDLLLFRHRAASAAIGAAFSRDGARVAVGTLGGDVLLLEGDPAR